MKPYAMRRRAGILAHIQPISIAPTKACSKGCWESTWAKVCPTCATQAPTPGTFCPGSENGMSDSTEIQRAAYTSEIAPIATYMVRIRPNILPAFSLWNRISLAMAAASRKKIKNAAKVTTVLGK